MPDWCVVSGDLSSASGAVVSLRGLVVTAAPFASSSARRGDCRVRALGSSSALESNASGVFRGALWVTVSNVS